MPTIATIGFRRKPLARFITLLRENNVDAIIDVRLRNTSQLAGYTKRDDLDFLLREGFGIGYEHRTDLAPTEEILDAFKADKDWSAYEERFASFMEVRRLEQVAEELLSRYCRPCLLCSEPTAEQCHRRLIAEDWARHVAELTILHL